MRILLVSSAKEAAFRKVVEADMVRDRQQHGPLLELNRFGVKSKRRKNNSGGGGGKEESTRSLFAQMVNKAAA